MTGNLADEPLASLLHQLFAQKATGVLRLKNRSDEHVVYLRDGFPVAVTLPGSPELIGKVLFEMGILDEATYKKSLAAPPPPGKKYGEMLLDMGVVTNEHMRLALKAQVRRKLHRLFFVGDGTFLFDAGDHKEGVQKEESLKIHPARAIYHGVRSAWNAERLKGALFLLADRAIKCTLAAEEIGRYGIGPADGRVAELLRRGYWLLPDLVDASALPAQAVHALVYAFYITEALDIKAAAEVPRLRKRADSLPPVPAVTPSHSGSNPPDVSGAYTMPSSVTPLPIKPTTESPDVENIKRQLGSKAAVVEKQNLFEVLEIPQTATREEIKDAYFAAAKKYHPDRLASLGLEAWKSEVEKVFRRVSEAYGTLYDDERRAQYTASLRRPQSDAEEAHQKAIKIVEAEMAFRRGEVLLKKNDFLGAIRELEQAVGSNPQEGEHLAYLTWARVCAGQTTFGEGKTVLQQAIRLSPRCARAYYYLGLCLKEEEDVDRAYGMFKKAHELDARLIDAEREIRLINMRRENKKSSGFFDRFKRK